MKKNKWSVLISAAILSAVILCGCRDENVPDWEDTLPSTASETTVPTVVCETEETTTTTPEPTIITTEKTKRTAATESTPELATTTAPPPTEAEETTQSTTQTPQTSLSTEPTIPTDIPNVPIKEYTSSTAAEPTVTSESDEETAPSSESSAKSNESTGVVEAADSTEMTITEIDTIGSTYSKDEIQRPYSYNQLSEKQMYIYDAVITAAERLKTDVPLSTIMGITAEEYCEVYQQIYNDEHALFYIDTKMQYAMNNSTKKLASAVIYYKYSDERILEMQKAIETEAKRVLDGVTPQMTEYEVVKYFHDYLASNVVYDETAENCRDIYGVFVDKKAICGGYSKAFSYLCDKVGIETITVTGDADGEAHMWNMVKIDGQWYNIDITYAVTDSELGSYVRYDYFCVPDSMLTESRTIYEQIYTYPKAISEDCGYFVKNGLIADSWEDVRAMLINQIAEVSKTDDFVIQVKCSSRELYDEAVNKLFSVTEKQAIKIFEEALPSAAKKYDCAAINYSQDKTSMVIKLFLDYIE
ncbi:MAG: hypothetical protein IJC04_05535 [Oscillospiraceae bacterium]|nr:hypothetical protein [Oscillospiraceae bacterium]